MFTFFFTILSSLSDLFCRIDVFHKPAMPTQIQGKFGGLIAIQEWKLHDNNPLNPLLFVVCLVKPATARIICLSGTLEQ